MQTSAIFATVAGWQRAASALPFAAQNVAKSATIYSLGNFAVYACTILPSTPPRKFLRICAKLARHQHPPPRAPVGNEAHLKNVEPIHFVKSTHIYAVPETKQGPRPKRSSSISRPMWPAFVVSGGFAFPSYWHDGETRSLVGHNPAEPQVPLPSIKRVEGQPATASSTLIEAPERSHGSTCLSPAESIGAGVERFIAFDRSKPLPPPPGTALEEAIEGAFCTSTCRAEPCPHGLS